MLALLVPACERGAECLPSSYLCAIEALNACPSHCLAGWSAAWPAPLLNIGMRRAAAEARRRRRGVRPGVALLTCVVRDAQGASDDAGKTTDNGQLAR